MQDAAVVEEHEVALLPVVRVDVLGRDAGTLESVHPLADLGQVLDDGAVGEVKSAHSRGMDLQREFPRHGIAPAEGQDLRVLLAVGRQLVDGHLQTLREQAETVGPRFGRAHPHIRMGRVLDLRPARECLVFVGQRVVHRVSRHEGRRAERHVQFVARPVVVATGLTPTTRHLHGEKGRNDGWRKRAVQRSVDVPAVETREVQILVIRNGRGMERPVVRVSQLEVRKPLVGGHPSVPDDLHLGLVRDGLQIRVQDAPFRIDRLAVPVGGAGRGIKALRQLELGLRRDVSLVLEHEHLVREQGVADHGEIIVYRRDVSRPSGWLCARCGDTHSRRLPIDTGILPTAAFHHVTTSRQVFLPVKFSMSTFDAVAPKSMAEPSGKRSGSTIILDAMTRSN